MQKDQHNVAEIRQVYGDGWFGISRIPANCSRASYQTTGEAKNSHDFLNGAVLFKHLPDEYGTLQGSSGYVSADTSGNVYELFCVRYGHTYVRFGYFHRVV